jgi:cell wall-associated NlpC family hydrolase
LAELGNDAYLTRRERKLAEKKSVAKSARSLATAVRARSAEVVSSSKEVVAQKVAPQIAPKVASARTRIPKISLNRRGLGRAVVMSVALGIIGTSALPAYAVDHTAHVDVAQYQALLESGAQSVVPVEGSAALTVTRDGISTGTAPQVFVNTTATARDAVDVSAIKSNSAFLSVALGLVGIHGDCTIIVETALRRMGYEVGDIGPMGFGRYGAVFSDRSQVQPGDIMMRGNHVAIYAGNGLAVQGGIGYNSYLTSMDSSPNNYALFVRVGG